MQHEPKKIALFVDFDNIYLGLRETSREAAEAFATRPQVWLKWIEQGMPIGEVEPGAPKANRVLIRHCYLNPDTFGKYRGYFTRAGFSVVDCPSLTSRGKNSSDIVMVMDILDALRHETRFDRFVIMSADADFTPVLQRLRAHDRRTAVMVSGLAAPAYRAACDRLIEEDVFIEHALELPPTPEPVRAPAPAAAPLPPSAAAIRDPELLAAIGRRIYEEASSSGTLPASELPRILREFKEFTPTSNWLGYYSLQALTEAVLEHRPELRITDDDPWRIAVQVAEEPAAAPAAAGAPQPAPAEAEPDWEAVRDRVVQLVARMVAESSEPVVMGKAAHAAILEVGPRLTETRWLGRGTFKNLLLSARELPFRVVASPLPGYVFDPERHQPPSERASVDGLAELGAEMASLVRRISQLTDAPKLTPRQYRMMWEVIAKELGRAPYNLMGTGKAVRDQCVERGEPIARQAITWVLRGLGYVGYRFDAPAHRPEDLAVAYRGNLLNILRQAQVTLSDDELRMLDEWLLAADAAPASDAPAADARPAPRSRRQAPADPDAAAEPDYAAWADALLAGASNDRQPPALQSEPAPFEWPPRDALRFEPTESRPWLRDDGARSSNEDLFDSTTPAQTDGAIPADAAPAVEPTTGDAESSVTLASGDAVDAVPADAQPAEPTVAFGPMADAGAADAPADESPQPAHAMQDDSVTPPDEQPAHPAIEGDAQPADVASADWQLSTDSAPSDAPPAEPAREGGASQPDIVPADWQMAEEARSDSPADGAQPVVDAQPSEAAHDRGTDEDELLPWESANTPTGSEQPDADAQPAVEATRDGDAPPADIVPAECQMADEPLEQAIPAAPEARSDASDAEPSEPPRAEHPADAEVVTAEWHPAEESAPAASEADHPAQPDTPPAEPRAEQRVDEEIVTAQWQPAEDAPAAADQPARSAASSPESPRAEHPADGEVVNATWQPEDAAPAASDADQRASSADAEPAPSTAPEPPPDGIFTAAWEPVADTPASEQEPSAPAAEAAPESSAPEQADDVVTPQWEPATSGAGPAGSSPADPRPGSAAQMDAFPPEPPRDGGPEQVPAELSAAPHAAPPREEPPPQERQGWQ